MDSVTNSISNGFTTFQTNAMSLITDAIPIIIAIVGAIVLISFGMKLFRKLKSA